MTQLSLPSRPGAQTSAHPLRSLPDHWRAWTSESRLSRFWRHELLVGDLQPMHQQLALLAVALDEAVRVRYAGSARPAVEEAVQQLDLAVLDHQHFLTTLAAGWRTLYEFPAYQRLLMGFRQAVHAWQQTVLVGDAQEPEYFRRCERMGWRLLGHACLLIDMFAESAAVAGEVDVTGVLPPCAGRPRRLWRALRRILRRLADALLQRRTGRG
ncbi:Uncharacterised protein [Delftia tsuruhatensis]|uniref:hypothetical protein n=1 Tax=Delftia tsuruhatensis TaxID=180282 RepID=UPI001E6FA039|nr:hypothetical protein [Delftia tsuruhatensis]CAB5701589.1 Uncharacterised protein [Delftia tsuruhatensis]CAC9691507.1 Uncharacterised protein [Delftia tsuruhatensis]